MKELEKLLNQRKEPIFKSNQYERIIAEFLKSERCQNLNEEQKKRLQKIFALIEQKLLTNVEQDKFKIPYRAYLEEIERIFDRNFEGTETLLNNVISIIEERINKYINIDGKYSKDILDNIYSLYINPNISLGIHGTCKDYNYNITANNNEYFNNGLILENLSNLRHTVAFQKEENKNWTFSNKTFLDIITYSFHTTGIIDKPNSKGIIQKQFSVLIAIPSNLEDDADILFNTNLPTSVQEKQYYLGGKKKALLPKYIVGMLKDSDYNTFVMNPHFHYNITKKTELQQMLAFLLNQKRETTKKINRRK